MKRFFAFGCSYTRWWWPTVADFIGINFDQYINLGHGGNSNSHMAHEFMYAHKKYNFTKNDFIYIGVTGIGREVLIEEEQNTIRFVKSGDTFPKYNPNHEYISRKYTDHIDNWAFAAWRSSTALNTCKLFLEQIGCKYKIIPAVYNDPTEYRRHPVRKRMFSNIQSNLSIKQSIDEFWQTTNEPVGRTFDSGERDGHPSPTVHYEYFKKYFKEYNSFNSLDLYNETKNVIVSSTQDQRDFWNKIAEKRGIFLEDICKRYI